MAVRIKQPHPDKGIAKTSEDIAYKAFEDAVAFVRWERKLLEPKDDL